MSLPPEKVCVKRKKGEEPVDALYIQAEHQQKKPRFADFVFRRVQGDTDVSLDTAPNSQHKALNQSSTHGRQQVPVVKTTVAEPENTPATIPKARDDPTTLHPDNGRPSTPASNTTLSSASAPTLSPPKPESENTLSPPGHPSSHVTQPRLFQLTRPAHAHFTQGPSGGVQKRKRGEKSDVAVFIERQRDLKKPRSLLNLIGTTTPGAQSQTSTKIIDHEAVEKEEETLRPRKRPGASAEEKKWREENWSQTKPRILGTAQPSKQGQTVQSKASDWDYESSCLAEQLQDVALQEIQKFQSTQPSPGASPKLKLKPKVPALRYKDRHPEEREKVEQHDPFNEMETHTSDDEDYVYDTYIRHPGLADGSDFNNMMGSEKNIGFLVITEEDQPIWETYAEDEDDSDKDWNSEEEDENGKLSFLLPLLLSSFFWLVKLVQGCRIRHFLCILLYQEADLFSLAENYYAADYPEEEVDSEDEFDRGAYHFRQGGSDEEEYDADNAAWSDDDEDMVRYPWKRHAWSTSAGNGMHDDNESDSS
ncbi:hypothetical protein L228DRAFT_153808 [Xylona heveae TC161]|uniref:Transcription factor Iwr1 domain-containing protein n=1 Tax=Xylona heveae (strain CBS 132557 / TC161) TaxID=1328760 RepID=A0A165FWG1_XYLHT|nr:hypothetical protein L228DRAFT_153808 [Xylona heveae TC161]KZF21465.1 hypothetical protein L228DRAFT_153808 [Xylona heveae TC161]